MRKEVIFVATVGLFALSYGLDYIAGPVSIRVKDPIVFLTGPVISKYPLTALAIGIRTIALFSSVLLLFSLVEKKFFTKSFISLFLTILTIFYAIQQMATGAHFTPMQWTLSFAYTGMLMIPAVGLYALKGMFAGIRDGLSGKSKKAPPEALFSEKKTEEQTAQ